MVGISGRDHFCCCWFFCAPYAFLPFAVVDPQKLAYERQARSLFTIRESLKDQNAELVDDVNKRQYKFIIEGHRKELLASDGAAEDEQDGSGPSAE